MHKITPFLWFNNQAVEAAKFYVSIFENSRILGDEDYNEEASQTSGQPEGSVMLVNFELDGQHIMAMNGGPHYQLNEAFSLYVNCASQEEVDYYWDKLTAEGGEPGQCGWLKDKFGLSWQIVPDRLGELMGDEDPEKVGRVVEAMLKMGKLDIAGLEQAYEAS